MADQKVLLVDANSLANRAFYALPPLSTVNGVPTGAVYGFLTMLLKLIDETKPGYILCAFDHPTPTFRHEEFEEYKGTRKPSPEEFIEQIPLLKEALSVLDMPIIELPGYEADDIIGTLACTYSKNGFPVTILSGDKDCLQLVGDNREVVIFVRGISETKEYDRDAVIKDMGVSPEQVPDFKGLAGDPSDNIPGVKGIGPKTAVKLLQEYGTLENIYANIDKVTPKRVQTLLREHKDAAFLSKRLATIVCNAPCKVEPDQAKWEGLDAAKVRQYFENMEFRSLLKRLADYERKDPQGPDADSQRTSSRDVPGMLHEEEEPNDVPAGFYLVDEEEKLEKLAKRIAQTRQISLYAGPYGTETSSLASFSWPEILGVSDGDKPYLVDFGAHLLGSKMGTPMGRPLDLVDPNYQDLMWKYMGPILEDPNVRKVGFNQKWPITISIHRGLDVKGLEFDAMVAAYLLDPTRTTYRLDDLAKNYLGEDLPNSFDDFSKSTRDSREAHDANREHLAKGAFFATCLVPHMRKELEENSLLNLALDVEFPLINVLADMEATGLGVDLEKGKAIRSEFAMKLDEIQSQAYEIAGEEFNLDSPKQVSHVLFEKLNLPPVKKTKTGYSTDAEVLETLSAIHPLPAKILEYRHYSKLKSTYLDVLETVINPNTGRIHSTFHQAVTATGRLSSSEPNLQNIPVKDEDGKSIRSIFVPAPGNLFLASDYSQIELRIMAHMSQDPSLILAFRNNEDIHRRTAAEIFGCPLEEVTPELRSKAKAVNFGIIYGISDFGLARNAGVSREEARQFIDTYFQRYPRVKEYMERAISEAKRTGYVTTILGRRRPIPEINSRNNIVRRAAERTAINTPIQGSAADIIKLAMVRIHKRFDEEGLSSKMVLQVHDELIFEIPPSEEKIVRKIVETEMEGAIELKVPLTVQIDVGRSWDEV